VIGLIKKFMKWFMLMFILTFTGIGLATCIISAVEVVI